MTVKPEITENTTNNQATEIKQDQPEQKLEAQTPENQEQINWRKFREERKKEREEKEAIAKRAAEKEAEASALKAAMEAMLAKPLPDSEEEESEDKKLEQKIAAEIERRERLRQEEQRKREAQELPSRLNSMFPDFSNVCTQENLDYLEYHHPEIAKALTYMPDGVDKWSTVYKTVKKFIPNTESKRDEKRMEKNALKPKSMSAGLSTTGDQAPVYLDDAKRNANWERMQRVMRGG